MYASLSRWLSHQPAAVATATDREALLAQGLDLVRGTARVPAARERALLDRFVRGQLTIDQVLVQLEAPEFE